MPRKFSENNLSLLHEKQILIGECKWEADGIDRQIARELIEQKTPKVLASLPDDGRDLSRGTRDWQVHHAIFARAGFTDAAQSEMQKVNGMMVDLGMLDVDTTIPS